MNYDEYDFEIVDSGREKTWRLPHRDTTVLKQIGTVASGFGIFACLFMICWISGPLYIGAKMFVRNGEMFGLLFIGFSMLGFGGLLIALRMVIIGQKIIANQTRCDVTLRGKWLIAAEEIGWFDWRRKCKVSLIDELEIRKASEHKRFQSSGTPPQIAKKLEDMTAVIAIGDDLEFLVAVGYSEELCIKLADQISTEIGRSVSSRISLAAPDSSQEKAATLYGVSEQMSELESGPTVTMAAEAKEVEPELPAGSRLKLNDQSGQFACEIPAKGLRGVAGFFAFFSTFWTGISVFICAAALIELINGDPNAKLFEFLFTVPFVLIGIGLCTATVYMASLRVMLGLLGDQLFVRKRSVFGEKWFEFSRDDIIVIDVGPSGSEVNDEPVMELKIRTRSQGKPHGLLSQLDDAELEWLAWQLRKELDIKSSKQADEDLSWQTELERVAGDADISFGKSNEIALPDDSKIEIIPRHDSVDIDVPSRGILKSIGPSIFIAVFMGIPSAIIYFNPDEIILWFFVAIAGLMCSAIFMSTLIYTTRSFSIRADAHELEIDRRDIFFTKKVTWFRPDIKEIEIYYSGMKVNGNQHLQLVVSGSPDFKLMSGWSRHELAVVAAQLNRVLKLRPTSAKQADETT